MRGRDFRALRRRVRDVTGREEPAVVLLADGSVCIAEAVDDELVRWLVTERDAHDDPGARAERCLIFACDHIVRRVWDYPPGWRELPAAALLALCWPSGRP